jgi:glycine/D-amino acid oxidase-like deaminating enzyme
VQTDAVRERAELHALVRDMLQSFPDTADEQEWRGRAGEVGVTDPDGEPYRAYTGDDL